MTASYANRGANELEQRKIDFAHAEDKIKSLLVALQSARHVGCAVGILMATHHVTDEVAFEMIVNVSQHNDLTVNSVAQYVTLNQELPPAR